MRNSPFSLISVDPGVKYLAWAFWSPSQTLLRCVWHSMPTLDSPWPFEAGRHAIICEGQAHYRGLSNAEAVLGLARMTGAVVSRAVPGEGRIVLPQVWKRQLSRNATHDLVLSLMDEGDRETHALGTYDLNLSQKRDVTAAIGIGMWHFGRLKVEAGTRTRT